MPQLEAALRNTMVEYSSSVRSSRTKLTLQVSNKGDSIQHVEHHWTAAILSSHCVNISYRLMLNNYLSLYIAQ